MDYIYLTTGLPSDHPARTISPDKQIGDLEIIGQLFSGNYISVTGTKGKTTLCHLLGDMLTRNEKSAHVHGELASGPLDNILNWSISDIPVLEVNHVQLDSKFPSFSPHIAVLLNILDDHGDDYDPKRYAELKVSIFKHMKPGSYAIINIDDPLIIEMLIKNPIPEGVNIITISLNSKSCAEVHYESGQIYTRRDNSSFETKGLSLLGKHHLYTYMAAIAVAGITKLDSGKIREFQSLEHRLEKLQIQNYTIYNDPKSTIPAATKAGINALKDEGYQDLVLVIGGKTKGTDMSILKDALQSGINSVHVYGTEAEAICKMLEGTSITIHRYYYLEEAVSGAAKHLTNKNALLFSPGCSSKDQFSSYEHRGKLFKEYISAALRI
jgi:UDP-N-acetylmuramoylalanine--D-glutamate ligase